MKASATKNGLTLRVIAGRTRLVLALGCLMANSSVSAQTNTHQLVRTAATPTIGRTGVWRSGRVMLPVLTGTSNFTVVSHQGGTNFSSVPDSVTMISGKPHIVIPTNTWTILRSTERLSPVKLSTNITLARDVGVACVSSTQGVDAQLFLKLDDSPMPWDKRRLEYCTRVRVGFAATNTSLTRLPSVAVHLQTHNLRLVDETKRVFTLHEPGIAGSVPISIFTEKFATGASVLASTDVGEEKFLIEIQRLGLWDMIIQLCPGPTLFLVAMGSASGGFLHFLRVRKSKEQHRKKWYWFVIEGLVAGPLILALVIGLGVNLPVGRVGAATLASPWAWLAIAAIGGYGGARLFESMTKKRRQVRQQDFPNSTR